MKSLTFIKNRPPRRLDTIFPRARHASVNNPGLSVIKDHDTFTLTVPLAPGGKSFARFKVTP